MIQIIPYIIIVMIIYDLSIHLAYLLNLDKSIIKRKLNWWFNWWGLKYQVFWIIYWSIALILMIIYVLFGS